MCSSRKYPDPPNGQSLEIPNGWRSLLLKFVKECMTESRWVGGQTKNVPSGDRDIF